MGQEIETTAFTPEDFAEFHRRLALETRLLEQWFADGVFCDEHPVGGFELECCLLDAAGDPAPVNQQCLQEHANPFVVPELALFNLEINGTARPLKGDVFSRMAEELDGIWRQCNATAHRAGAHLGMIGILPTLRQADLSLVNMSPLNRYRALNEQVFRLRRGEPIELDIDGPEPLKLRHADVMLESAATSFQIHLQVRPQTAARVYNLSKILSAPMVALSANSPFLFGQDLWSETRIPLFEQSISVGASDLTKRVSFGIRYVYSSIMENFTANLERYPVLLPKLMDDPPERLSHLRLHNGTIWRWNRPLIGFDAHGRPHIRIEHRVVPAGPGVADSIANAAFYFGLVVGLEKTEKLEERLPFTLARDNFYAAAREAMSAEFTWLDGHKVRAKQLLQEELLPLARRGLNQLGVDPAEVEHWLGPIQGRLETGQTGAVWQRTWVKRHGQDMHGLTQAYVECQDSGLPVYAWSV